MPTEATGLPVGEAIDGAKRHDMKRVQATLGAIPVERPVPSTGAPRHLCVDIGCDYEETRALVAEFGFTAHIRSRGEEARAMRQEPGYHARRWVVESTHSWPNRSCGLWARWEKRTDTYLARLHLAWAIIPSRAAGLLG